MAKAAASAAAKCEPRHAVAVAAFKSDASMEELQRMSTLQAPIVGALPKAPVQAKEGVAAAVPKAKAEAPTKTTQTLQAEAEAAFMEMKA